MITEATPTTAEVDDPPAGLTTMERYPLGWHIPSRVSFSIPFTKGGLVVMLDGELMTRQEYAMSRSDYADWRPVNLGLFRLLLRLSW